MKEGLMKLSDCRFNGTGRFSLKKHPTSAKMDKKEKKKYQELTAKNTKLIAEQLEKLYAQRREGVVIVLQAMDAAGKDSAIKHVLSGINPLHCKVTTFKNPSKEELAHDYLWRVVRALPQRGTMGVFNRSHYEDVLVVRAKNMRQTYAMPDRFFRGSDKAFFDARFRQIREFEQHLYENGYRICKIFLNIGLDEQKKRFLARIEEPEKNWKFSVGDLDNRPIWPQYMDAYEKAIAATSTNNAPWYIIPADQKWYARWLVSEAILATLKECKAQFPTYSEDEKVEMYDARERLVRGEI